MYAGVYTFAWGLLILSLYKPFAGFCAASMIGTSVR